MTKQLQAEVEVQASAERVWEVLTDFAAYPQWNPFIVKASGEPVPGTRLELHMRLAGRRTTSLRPEVLDADPAVPSAGSAGSWCPACSTASTASPSSPPARAGSA